MLMSNTGGSKQRQVRFSGTSFFIENKRTKLFTAVKNKQRNKTEGVKTRHRDRAVVVVVAAAAQYRSGRLLSFRRWFLQVAEPFSGSPSGSWRASTPAALF